MNWRIIIRWKFNKKTIGWYDGSKCCWSTDSNRAVSYTEKEHAETTASSLKEKYPNAAEYIHVEMI